LAVRLGSLNSPAKVSSFLVLPIPDPKLFDTTLAFLALGALPLTALFYHLGGRLQPPQKSAVGKAGPNGSTLAEFETDPLIRKAQNLFPFWGSLPVLEGYAWPECPSSIIDRRLVVGSILFGVGWGMLGVCRTYIDSGGNHLADRPVSLSCGPELWSFYLLSKPWTI
jgi:uncharacterized membrane protein YedE/YeeE